MFLNLNGYFSCRAFCNPADVEAFTEEKKQSLLTKRQGRGADFVRAVQEIIDSYEKLKKQDQVDSNSGDELTVANGGNSVNSISHLKDRSLRSSASWTAGQFLSFSSLPEALLFTETELGSEALQM